MHGPPSLPLLPSRAPGSLSPARRMQSGVASLPRLCRDLWGGPPALMAPLRRRGTAGNGS
jgi:hypothetical protein